MLRTWSSMVPAETQEFLEKQIITHSRHHNNSFKQKNCMTGFQHEIVPWGQIGVEVVLHSKVIVHNI